MHICIHHSRTAILLSVLLIFLNLLVNFSINLYLSLLIGSSILLRFIFFYTPINVVEFLHVVVDF